MASSSESSASGCASETEAHSHVSGAKYSADAGAAANVAEAPIRHATRASAATPWMGVRTERHPGLSTADTHRHTSPAAQSSSDAHDDDADAPANVARSTPSANARARVNETRPTRRRTRTPNRSSKSTRRPWSDDVRIASEERPETPAAPIDTNDALTAGRCTRTNTPWTRPSLVSVRRVPRVRSISPGESEDEKRRVEITTHDHETRRSDPPGSFHEGFSQTRAASRPHVRRRLRAFPSKLSPEQVRIHRAYPRRPRRPRGNDPRRRLRRRRGTPVVPDVSSRPRPPRSRGRIRPRDVKRRPASPRGRRANRGIVPARFPPFEGLLERPRRERGTGAGSRDLPWTRPRQSGGRRQGKRVPRLDTFQRGELRANLLHERLRVRFRHGTRTRGRGRRTPRTGVRPRGRRRPGPGPGPGPSAPARPRPRPRTRRRPGASTRARAR